MEQVNNFKYKFESLRISQMIIRILASMSIFTITVFFTPNFLPTFLDT